jgi:hypothetical protein
VRIAARITLDPPGGTWLADSVYGSASELSKQGVDMASKNGNSMGDKDKSLDQSTHGKGKGQKRHNGSSEGASASNANKSSGSSTSKNSASKSKASKTSSGGGDSH